MIFLELVPHSAMCVLSKKCSERSGSFFLYSNDLRIAVLGRVEIIDRAGICFVYICNNVKEC